MSSLLTTIFPRAPRSDDDILDTDSTWKVVAIYLGVTGGILLSVTALYQYLTRRMVRKALEVDAARAAAAERGEVGLEVYEMYENVEGKGGA